MINGGIRSGDKRNVNDISLGGWNVVWDYELLILILLGVNRNIEKIIVTWKGLEMWEKKLLLNGVLEKQRFGKERMWDNGCLFSRCMELKGN